MNTNACRISYEDTHSSRLNEAGEKEFSGVTDPQNAGKDLNNITDLMKKHYLRGFDTLEIEISKDFFEHYQEQIELIKSYLPLPSGTERRGRHSELDFALQRSQSLYYSSEMESESSGKR